MRFGDNNDFEKTERFLKIICNGGLGIATIIAYMLIPHCFLGLLVLSILLWQD